jgi:PKD domain
MTRRWLAVAIVAGLGAPQWSCTGTGPSAPSPADPPVRAGSAAVSVTAQNAPPDTVFRTTPPARGDGEISGPVPLEITFNMCPTTDEDEGDELKFKYDFEDSGGFERGRCRATHTYTRPGVFRATVCASDRQPDHDVCRTYTVRALGSSGAGAAAGAGNARFRFYLWNGNSSGNAFDSVRATIDGAVVFQTTEGNPAYTGGYALVDVPIGVGAHTIGLETSVNDVSAAISNFSVDDVAVVCPSSAFPNPVADPSFEAGTGSGTWTEASTQFGSPICGPTAGCGGPPSVGPRTGAWWVWFGGATGVENASVSQNVTVPFCP